MKSNSRINLHGERFDSVSGFIDDLFHIQINGGFKAGPRLLESCSRFEGSSRVLVVTLQPIHS